MGNPKRFTSRTRVSRLPQEADDMLEAEVEHLKSVSGLDIPMSVLLNALITEALKARADARKKS